MKKVSIILFAVLLISFSIMYFVPTIQLFASWPQVGDPMNLFASWPQVGDPMDLFASWPQVGDPMDLIA